MSPGRPPQQNVCHGILQVIRQPQKLPNVSSGEEDVHSALELVQRKSLSYVQNLHGGVGCGGEENHWSISLHCLLTMYPYLEETALAGVLTPLDIVVAILVLCTMGLASSIGLGYTV